MAVEFDPVPSFAGYLALGTASHLELTGDITIAFWAKTDNTNRSVDYVLTCFKAASPFTGYGVKFNETTNGKLGYWSSGNGVWEQSDSTSYTDGNWHHCAVRIVGGTGTFFLDGVPDGTFSQTAPGAMAEGDKRIGGASANPGQTFDGCMADLRVWDVGLDDEDIAMAMRLLPVRPDALIGWWPMTGNANTPQAEPDWSGNDNPATRIFNVNYADSPPGISAYWLPVRARSSVQLIPASNSACGASVTV